MQDVTPITRPARVPLKPEHVKAFEGITKRNLELQARQASVQEFMKTIVQSSEARLHELHSQAQALHEDTRKLWGALKTDYKLDLELVNYDLSEDGTALDPIMVRVKQS